MVVSVSLCWWSMNPCMNNHELLHCPYRHSTQMGPAKTSNLSSCNRMFCAHSWSSHTLTGVPRHSNKLISQAQNILPDTGNPSWPHSLPRSWFLLWWGCQMLIIRAVPLYNGTTAILGRVCEAQWLIWSGSAWTKMETILTA